MKSRNLYKWIFVFAISAVVLIYGFTYIVSEGSSSVVTRFGAARKVASEPGLYMKMPWRFEKVYIFDARKQYTDTAYVETLTKDKRNVVLQTYAVWSIEDPLKFFKSVRDLQTAEKYLSDMVINVKNGVMGNYELAALVSTDINTIRIEEIENIMLDDVNENAVAQYGIRVYKVGLKRLGLPDSNALSVFTQMQAERQQYVDQLLAEGERDANIIINETNVKVAEIIAEGQRKSAEIRANTEKEVAQIYAGAYIKDPDFYRFLRKLTAIESTVDEKTTMILRIDEPPFDVLREYTE